MNTRRNFLTLVASVTAVLPMIGMGAAANHPDAELLLACAVFQDAAREVARTDAAPSDDITDEEIHASAEAWHFALVAVAGLPAGTQGGMLAKAAVCQAVLAYDRPDTKMGRFDHDSAERHDVLVWSLLGDMMRRVSV